MGVDNALDFINCGGEECRVVLDGGGGGVRSTEGVQEVGSSVESIII